MDNCCQGFDKFCHAELTCLKPPPTFPRQDKRLNNIPLVVVAVWDLKEIVSTTKRYRSLLLLSMEARVNSMIAKTVTNANEAFTKLNVSRKSVQNRPKWRDQKTRKKPSKATKFHHRVGKHDLERR